MFMCETDGEEAARRRLSVREEHQTLKHWASHRKWSPDDGLQAASGVSAMQCTRVIWPSGTSEGRRDIVSLHLQIEERDKAVMDSSFSRPDDGLV